jgi:hypothetical protein
VAKSEKTEVDFVSPGGSLELSLELHASSEPLKAVVTAIQADQRSGGFEFITSATRYDSADNPGQAEWEYDRRCLGIIPTSTLPAIRSALWSAPRTEKRMCLGAKVTYHNVIRLRSVKNGYVRTELTGPQDATRFAQGRPDFDDFNGSLRLLTPTA